VKPANSRRHEGCPPPTSATDVISDGTTIHGMLGEHREIAVEYSTTLFAPERGLIKATPLVAKPFVAIILPLTKGADSMRRPRRNHSAAFMNTDQGSQFTSSEFIGTLERHAIAISMDGKGYWRDNVLVKRLWKTISTSTSICPPTPR